MSRKKKVLIVEPSIIIKEGLIKILGKSPELDVLRHGGLRGTHLRGTSRYFIDQPDRNALLQALPSL